ncbi:uncharacterized protein LOC106867510 [Octopus bimaculoides]|uniref:uncharacterized protein LOC106867510 n=1 Tax=Octopus bimaculoides TaxID=37653 RepID=UPI00071C4A8C|nr:uncharacterized protein LOC106867510 [Octopus bimaculoides]|eukprot:XP_014767882.1 PREDICTED: uncharacterized protein LOC106867510 [Octopus bimaculoides]
MVTKKTPRAEKPKKPKINTKNTQDPAMRTKFQKYVKEQLQNLDSSSPDDMWNNMKSAIHDSAPRAFGKDRLSKEDWIEANASILMPLLEKKRKIFIKLNRKPTESTKQQLRVSKSNLQKETRKCANQYWDKLCLEIQQASDMKMYEMIRVPIRPRVSEVAPLKSATGDQLTDKNEQMERWVEHYSKLYTKVRDVDRQLDEAIPQLPEMTELDIPPTEEEFSTVIDEFASGKAPGNGNIPAEVLKENKDAHLPHLYKLLKTCWLEVKIPQDMRDPKIITLYKNKGDKEDCNNYRGISLLSITGKAFARIILKQLQKLAERVLPESQCGFRSNRSTMDMIFSIRQLQEKCREQQLPLYIAFVNLAKAFDTVSGSGL